MLPSYVPLLKSPDSLVIGALAIALAALLWSLDGVFLRPALFSLPSALVVFLEHALGFIILAPLLYLHRAKLGAMQRRTWMAIGWIALFGGALGTVFFTKALFLTGFTDISVVILLQKFQPIFALILAALFLRERFPKGFYLYAALALVGGYLVTFGGTSALTSIFSATGAVAGLSLLAAFAWGSSTVFGKYSLRKVDYGLLTALRFALTAFIMLVPALLVWGGSAASSARSIPWHLFVLIALTSGSGAMFLYYWGLKRTPASVATLVELVWPVSVIVLDYLVYGNTLSLPQFLGAATLVAAVARITYLMRPRILSGQVGRGLGKGRELGISTANLPLSCAGDLPMGLYACEVALKDGRHTRGLLYYGWNSLVNVDTLEVHLIGFNEHLYGQMLTVRTGEFLRLPKKFDSVADLMAQIKKDLRLVLEA